MLTTAQKQDLAELIALKRERDLKEAAYTQAQQARDGAQQAFDARRSELGERYGSNTTVRKFFYEGYLFEISSRSYLTLEEVEH
jgi:hypothetical protein